MKIWERVIRTVYFGEKATSESYIRYLRKKGVQIGKGTTFYAPHQCYVDVQYPWLVTIGKDVSITAGTRILSHDYSWSVLERVYGVKLGQAGAVRIEDNVFVGNGTIILPGTTIGRDTVIGAGSVVKGNIPPGSVAAGNPCRKIMDLESFFNKRKLRQKEEAALLANAYYAATGQVPPPYVLREFTGLYAKNTQGQREDTALYRSYQSLLDDILAKEDR